MDAVNKIADVIVIKVKQLLEFQEDIDLDEDLIALGLNSMDLMALSVDLEDIFNIDFKPEELLFKNFSSIRKLSGLIEKKMNG
ncbi:phosphopantetheine-binding protein [Paenibacillus oryzisoli]|uniref:Carrier domain-containing protein n=1 Tax=Paenibacillus oryzisoli TaxID=1850517 RepID=A0A197ZYR8_9BACL|nr:phosphopantetheine-binding protein [Paenibacillus oryzisoli]OAS14344.1 hypothetical protein A8708_13180 [Paenibacillus oryzisoli]